METVRTSETVCTKPCQLDIAFALDCTGSMGPCIKMVRRRIRNIMDGINKTQTCDIKLALVQYRDHSPQDTTFVTKSHEFVDSIAAFTSTLETCEALGGGDEPEAVADALRDILDLSWRHESVKMCVLVTDAPPHGLVHSDSFSQGCPDGLDTMKLTQEMAKRAISLYVIGCEPKIAPYRVFYEALGQITSGRYLPLQWADGLSEIITGVALEEISMGQWIQYVAREVKVVTEERGGYVNEEELSTRILDKLQKRGVQTTQLKRNTRDPRRCSPEAKQLANCIDMASARAIYQELPEWGSDEWRYGRYSPRRRRRPRWSRSRSRSKSKSRSRSRKHRRGSLGIPRSHSGSRSRSRSRSKSRSRKHKRGSLGISRSHSRSRSRRCRSRGSRSRSRSRSSVHVTGEEAWATVKSDITTDQVSRLVQRCLLHDSAS